MRKFTAVFLSLILLGGAATAQPQTSKPLAPGKPAGVQQAQSTRETLAVTGAALGLIVAFSILISGGNSDSAITPIAGGSNQILPVGGSPIISPTTSVASTSTT